MDLNSCLVVPFSSLVACNHFSRQALCVLKWEWVCIDLRERNLVTYRQRWIWRAIFKLVHLYMSECSIRQACAKANKSPRTKTLVLCWVDSKWVLWHKSKWIPSDRFVCLVCILLLFLSQRKCVLAGFCQLKTFVNAINENFLKIQPPKMFARNAYFVSCKSEVYWMFRHILQITLCASIPGWELLNTYSVTVDHILGAGGTDAWKHHLFGNHAKPLRLLQLT